MTDTASARLALPLLQPGQAQKELYHNEALALLDLAVQPAVEAMAVTAPPANPAIGACWIVGAGAGGAWTGRDGTIAGWTSGGWRFVAPIDGMAVWHRGSQRAARYIGGEWQISPGPGGPISDPVGGSTVDAECRTAVLAILATVRAQGLID